MPPHVLADLLRELPRLFDYTEVVLWPVMGLALLVAGRRRRGVVRRDFWAAGLVLLAFGASDYAEADTGNEWWTPWWLFLWKAGCVLALAGVLVSAWRRERRARRERKDQQPAMPEGVIGPRP